MSQTSLVETTRFPHDTQMSGRGPLIPSMDAACGVSVPPAFEGWMTLPFPLTEWNPHGTLFVIVLPSKSKCHAGVTD